MSESKFTPGPWTSDLTNVWINGKEQPPVRALNVHGGGGQSGHVGNCVCSLAPEGKITDEDLANARLIAAAPELLEALKDLFAMMDEGVLVRETANDADAGWVIKQLKFVSRLQKAHDAITKSEGATQC